MLGLVYVQLVKYVCGRADGGDLVIIPKDEILDGDARYEITRADGTAVTSLEDLANCKISLITDVIQEGTPITKDTLLDIMDFAPKTTTISGNVVTETDGTATKTTTFGNDGNVVEVLQVVEGGYTIRYTKTTTIADGTITETVSKTTV